MSESAPVGNGSRVLIIGGGIAGLAAAIGLKGSGHRVVLTERARRWRDLEFGSQLNIQPNGMRALAALHALRAVDDKIIPLERQDFYSWDGRTSFGSWPSAAVRETVGLPDALITRPALLRGLVAQLEPGMARLNALCIGFTESEEGITARFADGHEEQADVLIGADGLQSAIRQQLLGPHEPRTTGYSFTRGFTLSSIPDVAGNATRIYMGLGSWMGIYPIGRGRMAWYSVAPTLTDRTVDRAELLRRHSGWDGLVTDVLQATVESAISTAEVRDHPPASTWGQGRMTLLGDAAHAMPNSLAQGANQSLEDAAVLAQFLQASPDPVAAIRSYEAERIPRATEVQRRSQRLGDMFVSEQEMRETIENPTAREAMKHELAEQYKVDTTYPFLQGASAP